MKWYQLADRLGLPVALCQQWTTSKQFSEWMDYLAMEPNMFHREDHYFATMIAWLKRAIVKDPKAVRDEDSLIKFVMKNEEQNKMTSSHKSIQQTNREKGQEAKRFFGNLLAMSKVAGKSRAKK